MNYFKTELATARRSQIKKCPTSKQIVGKRCLMKL